MINLVLIFSLFNLLLSVIIWLYGEKIFILDKPDSNRKSHKFPVPLAGGTIIISNIMLILLFSQLDNFNEINSIFFYSRESIFSFYVGSFLIFLIGLYDDKYNIKPNIKLILLILIILSVILIDEDLIINELYFSSFNFHTTLDNFSIFFTILCFLLFLNAVNMFDGINLQLPLYALSLFLVLIYVNNDTQIFFIITVCLFFIILLNSRNRIFFGDNGSLLIAYILAYFIIKSNNIASSIKPEEIFLLMMIPGIDMFRLFLQRIISNKHPFKPDNNHLHHIILKKFKFPITLILIQLLILMPIIFYYLGFIDIIISILITFLIYLFLITNTLWLKK